MRKFAFIFILFFAVLIAGCSKGDCECSWVGATDLASAPVMVTGRVVNPLLPGTPGVEGITVTYASKTLAQKSLTDSSGNFSIEVPGNSNGTLNFIKHNYYAPPLDINTGSGGTTVIEDINASVLVWADMTEISYFVSTLFTFPSNYKSVDMPVIISPDGKYLYVINYYKLSYEIIRFDINTNELTLIAGTEPANASVTQSAVPGDKAWLQGVHDIEISPNGDVIYLTDECGDDYYIKKIVGLNNATKPSDVMVYTIYKAANKNNLKKLEVNPDGSTLYVASQNTSPLVDIAILKIMNVKNAENLTDTSAVEFAKRSQSTEPLSGSLRDVGFYGDAYDLEITPDGDTLYVSDSISIRKITGINTAAPQVVLLVGGSSSLTREDGIGNTVAVFNSRLALADDDTLFYFDQPKTPTPTPIKKLTSIKDATNADKTNVTIITRKEVGTQDGDMTSASFGRIYDITLNSQNTTLYFIDKYNAQSNYKIRSIVAKENL